MTAYKPVAYRQYHLTGHRGLGQTFDEMLGFSPAMGDVIRLVYHSGGAWLGLHVALANGRRPWLATVGWVIGIGMGVASILDVVSLGKRVAGTHP